MEDWSVTTFPLSVSGQRHPHDKVVKEIQIPLRSVHSLVSALAGICRWLSGLPWWRAWWMRSRWTPGHGTRGNTARRLTDGSPLPVKSHRRNAPFSSSWYLSILMLAQALVGKRQPVPCLAVPNRRGCSLLATVPPPCVRLSCFCELASHPRRAMIFSSQTTAERRRESMLDTCALQTAHAKCRCPFPPPGTVKAVLGDR